MKYKTIIGIALIGGVSTLYGCLPQKAAPSRNLVDMPILPIIQESISGLRPQFDGPNAKQMVGYICALARGEATLEQVSGSLLSTGIDPSKLPANSSTSLLLTGDRAGQAAACAAYIAFDAQSPVDLSDVTAIAPASANDGKVPAPQIDNARLAQTLRVKLASAHATADIFALIGAELRRNPGKSTAQYREQANQLFVRLAPVFLERVKQQLPPPNVTYSVDRLEPTALAFSASNGVQLNVSPGVGLTMRQNGVLWYGEGKLLGREYNVPVAYFPLSVNALLTSPEKT
ncbi:hypothetical protein [Pseudomonas sp. SCB32]|uniref:hypothetical protein n=1 Tax=Pseudomonas sp. SCB32 TaxID=2653853 RepID=UPI001264BDD3|nr:hypothetical protein [Pseudomonas sp. SCB32]